MPRSASATFAAGLFPEAVMQHADRGGARGTAAGAGAGRGLLRRDWRRIDGGHGQGDRARNGPADRRRADDLRRVGDDADLRHTEGGVKRTGRDRKVLPRTVIYDLR